MHGETVDRSASRRAFKSGGRGPDREHSHSVQGASSDGAFALEERSSAYCPSVRKVWWKPLAPSMEYEFPSVTTMTSPSRLCIIGKPAKPSGRSRLSPREVRNIFCTEP